MEATQKGKQFTIANDKGPTAVLLRSKLGLFISGAYEDSLEDKTKIFGPASFMLQTRNGEFIVASSETKVITYNTKTNSIIFEGDFNYIYSMTLSPNEKYVQILDKISTNEGKTILFELPQMKRVVQYQENQHSNYFSKQSYPLIRFTSDDQNYFRYTSKLLQVYNPDHKKIKQFKTGPLEFFEVSKISRQDSYVIACLYLDKKKNDGQCELFTSDQDQPVYQKHIKKAQEIKVKFSPTSNKFLMELQTYYDPTGKSYYGQYGLYLFNDETNKISRIKTENGPVHDFSWHQSGEKFIVISGFMPATSVLFNKENQKIFQFGKKHRNQIYWGKLGRFVCLAGLGNLSGEMEIWDLQTLKQIGFCKSNSASYCEWSHDDRKIMASIVTPRLRVDNCYKIYSYTGTYLKKVNFDHTELYDARWFNVGFDPKLKSRGLSPNRKIQVQQKKQVAKFKSFGASLNFESLTLKEPSKPNQPKLAPGQHPEDLYPKKKRRRKNNKQPDLGV